MTTPVIESAADSASGNNAPSNHTVNLPAGITADDLILLSMSLDAPAGATISWPAGYTEMYDTEDDNGGVSGSTAYRYADGTEGTTITVTTSAGRKSCTRAYRISGAEDPATQAPEHQLVTNEGAATNHTPPPITPAGGSDDYLYFAHCHFNTTITINTFPSGYTDTGLVRSFTSGATTGIAYCRKSTTGSSVETPSDYILSAARDAIPVTIAITPESTGTSSDLTGTITATITEADITAGGKTIIITLTGDTFKAAGTGPIGSTADTQALIDGFDAASSPANGWNNEVRDKALTSEIVRTSSTVATWTVAAQSGYDISSQEIITGTIPTAALVTGAGAITATPTFTIDAVSTGIQIFRRRIEARVR